MSVLSKFKSFWREHGNETSAEPIWMKLLTPDQISDPTLRARSGRDILPGVHYLQLTARRMNLRTDTFIGRQRFPVVHSQVVVDTTGGSRMTYPAIAGHDTIGELDLSATGKTSGDSYALTPVIPFHSGQVEMVAGVVSMKGEDAIGRLTRVVNRVTQLMPAAAGVGTAVATATGIATTALDCVEDLFGLPDAAIVLGMHQLYAGHIGTSLATGLYALLNPRPTRDESYKHITDPKLLAYDSEELMYRDSTRGLEPLREHDWLVIELGASTHRPYTSFPALVEAYNKSIADLTSDPQRAVQELNAALTLAGMSPQIVRADRPAVFAELREDFDTVAKAAGVSLAPASEQVKGKEADGGLLASGELDFTDFLVRIAL